MMYILIEDNEVRNPDNLELLGYSFKVDGVRYFMSLEQFQDGKDERITFGGTTTKL